MATKTELQEQALQLEVSIYNKDDQGGQWEKTKAELVDAIDMARTAAQEEHEAEQKEADRVRQEAADQAAADDGDEVVPPPPKPRANANATTNPPHPSQDPSPKAKVVVVRDPLDTLLKKMGTTVSDKDRKLAKKHGYPVAVPGGKAYTTAIRINCIYGAGTIQHGSVVILDAAQAAHKSKWLTPIK